ncbi:MAG TPA: hypothetical protein VGI74_20610 [Streptosporangiaceae bacterium]
MAAALRPGSPAVSGERPNPARRVIALHGAGLLAGAGIMGLLLVLVRALMVGAGLRFALIVPAGLALAIALLQCAGLPVPQSSWQVPEYWRRAIDADILPVAYGAILGFGVFTAVVVGAFWVFLAATFLYPAPVALAGWLAYACGRAAGFCLALPVRRLERVFLTARKRRGLILSTTLLAALVVFT